METERTVLVYVYQLLIVMYLRMLYCGLLHRHLGKVSDLNRKCVELKISFEHCNERFDSRTVVCVCLCRCVILEVVRWFRPLPKDFHFWL
jgi:hypothetical protein